MDFEGNAERIIESIRIAKSRGATFRTGPELEITYDPHILCRTDLFSGYGCLDHFLENDTYVHSWEMLCHIIAHPDCQDILLDIGMPVRHRSVYYNCRVIVYNKFIYLIRPKLWLANDGNYRERRYFQCWEKPRLVDKYDIPMTVCPLLASGQVPLYTSNTNFF
jgi:NAD+ synthase (glutamine-hydrolysing)